MSIFIGSSSSVRFVSRLFLGSPALCPDDSDLPPLEDVFAISATFEGVLDMELLVLNLTSQTFDWIFPQIEMINHIEIRALVAKSDYRPQGSQQQLCRKQPSMLALQYFH